MTSENSSGQRSVAAKPGCCAKRRRAGSRHGGEGGNEMIIKDAVAVPSRKRLDHRGPLSIEVSSAWYFITICAEGHRPWVCRDISTVGGEKRRNKTLSFSCRQPERLADARKIRTEELFFRAPFLRDAFTAWIRHFQRQQETPHRCAPQPAAGDFLCGSARL